MHVQEKQGGGANEEEESLFNTDTRADTVNEMDTNGDRATATPRRRIPGCETQLRLGQRQLQAKPGQSLAERPNVCAGE